MEWLRRRTQTHQTIHGRRGRLPSLCAALLIALALALALASAGCGRTITSPPAAQFAPTPTVVPAHALTWQEHSSPGSLAGQPVYPYWSAQLSLTPSDGATAYECAPDLRSGNGSVWATHDRGAHWATLPALKAGAEVDMCRITLDDLQPRIAVALAFTSDRSHLVGDFGGTYRSFVTQDGGQTWTAASSSYDTTAQIATLHGVTYGLFEPHVVDLAPLRSVLAVSRDGLRTWTPIDAAIRAQPGQERSGWFVTQFWLNPATGELLALAQTSFAGSGQFWVSDDGGATWKAIHTPQADEFLVQYPFAAEPWHICGVHSSTTSEHPYYPNGLTCTDDGGRTWADRGGPGQAAAASCFAIANDGSVLRPAPDPSIGLERLPPGASDWQSLGPIPDTGGPLFYEPGGGAGSGVLWSAPTGGGPETALGNSISTASYA